MRRSTPPPPPPTTSGLFARRSYYRYREVARGLVPVALVAGTLGSAFALHFGGGMSSQVTGYGRAPTSDVSSAEIARITEIRFEVGANVLSGDVIATLDTSGIDSEISVAQAERDELVATVRAERARQVQGLDEQTDLLERQLALAKEDQARVGGEAYAIKIEKERLTKLVTAKQALGDDLAKIGLREAELSPLLSTKPKTIAIMNAQAESLKKRKDALEPVTQDLEAKVVLADRKLEQLQVRRENFVLRASEDGRIAEVIHRAGEIVRPGDPIVRVVSRQLRVAACVPDGKRVNAVTGMGAKVRPKGATTPPIKGTVLAASPIVGELPVPCRDNPTVASWGRQIIVAVDAPDGWVSGQSFDVEFDTELPQSAAVPIAKGPPLREIAKPESLASETRFEPSGLAWDPGSDGYLVVSDDTGLGEDHVPILFSLSKDGLLSPSVLPIHGIDEVTDLESIATSKSGQVFVMASQSHSRKGKRSRARTAFLELAREASGLRVVRKTSLSETLEALGPERLEALGIGPTTTSLEIEGMAYYEGALYFGLKAPLDNKGRAIVWIARNPEALAEGRGADAGLSIYARARLDIGSSEHRIGGGVAELLWSPSGQLLVGSTPSSGDEALGAVFRLIPPSDGTEVHTAELIQAFPGRKPEGLVTSRAAPTQFWVVFDNGARNPEIAEIAFP